MEFHALVVAFLRELDEVVDCFWSVICVEFDIEVAEVGADACVAFILDLFGL